MWKKFLTLFLSFTLLTFQTQIQMGSVAYASGSGEETTTEEPPADETPEEAEDRIQSENEDAVTEIGSNEATANLQGTNTAEGAADEMLIWSIISMVLGLVAIIVGIYWGTTSCVGVADTIVWSIAAGVALLAEITFFIAFLAGEGKVSEQTINNESKDKQIASIEAAVEETEEAITWTMAREIVQYIVTVAYLAAAIVAFALGAMGKTPWGANIDQCRSQSTAPAVFNIEKDHDPLKPSRKFTQQIREAIGKWVTAAGNFVVPKAHAEGEAGGALGAIGIGVASIALFTQLGQIFSTNQSAGQEGVSRGAIMLVWAGFELAAAGTTTSKREEFERRKSEYEALYSQLSDGQGGGVSDDNSSDGTLSAEGVEVESVSSSEENLSAEKYKPIGKGSCGEGDVFKTSEGKFNVSQKCSGNTARIDHKIDRTPFANIGGVDGALDTGDQVTQAFNEMSSKDGLSRDLASSMGTMGAVNKMKKMKNKLLKSFHQQIDGFPSPKEINDYVDAESRGIRSMARQELSKLSADQLEAITKDLGARGGDNLKEKGKKDVWSKQLAKLKKPKYKPAKRKRRKFGLTSKNKKKKAVFDDEPIDHAKELQGLKLGDNDILKKPDVSIFKVLSTRYRRSAFPIFFEEMEMEHFTNESGEKKPGK